MPDKKKKDDILEDIKSIILGILEKLELKAEVAVEAVTDVTDSKEEHYLVNISTEESGLLIGRHGETLNSLQLLLGVILFRKTGSWKRVILDVGDYRKNRQESIKQMAERIALEVESTNQPVTLPVLTPYERRVVHILLSNHEKVTTESSGEGRERRLVIKPK